MLVVLGLFIGRIYFVILLALVLRSDLARFFRLNLPMAVWFLLFLSTVLYLLIYFYYLLICYYLFIIYYLFVYLLIYLFIYVYLFTFMQFTCYLLLVVGY